MLATAVVVSQLNITNYWILIESSNWQIIQFIYQDTSDRMWNSRENEEFSAITKSKNFGRNQNSQESREGQIIVEKPF